MQPKRNNLYEATIRRMVQESLERKNNEFIQSHSAEPDGLLLDYLKETAEKLGHAPHQREILGSELLVERFGSWEAALTRARLPMPSTPDKLSAFKLYQDEELEQKQVYAHRKAIKKQMARIREAQREKRKKENNRPVE